jgi:hypothetical protein
MEDRPATRKRRRLRVPVLTVLVCALVAIAFLHINAIGVHCIPISCGNRANMWWEDTDTSEVSRAQWTRYRTIAYDPDKDYFCHGWPTPFAEHVETSNDGTKSPAANQGSLLLDRANPLAWISFRMNSINGAISDTLLAVLLIVATLVAVLRLERRGWSRWQFSIADMFSLIATTSMVLGLVYFDGRLSFGEDPVVEDMYVRLCDLPLFDRAMVLLAIACAVWLIVSTAANRLGDKCAGRSQ